MSLPTSTRAFRRTSDGKGIELVSEPVPQKLQPTEVLLKIHAVSLNFRDVGMLHNRYPIPVIPHGVPCSDASATIISVGSSVTEFAEGDSVAPTFRETRSGEIQALGGDVDGVLREYAVFDQCDVIKIPNYLTHEEASTIPCAGVTAWTALDFDKKKQGKSALMQGTGVVSIFATLLCVAAGMATIITSSSDEKLKKCRDLSQGVQGINYRTNRDWSEEAKKLTHGKGVDVVVNNVGITSMEQCFNALARYGTISLVGFLGGVDEAKMPDCFTPVLMKAARVQGIFVGTRDDQQDLCAFLEAKKVSLKPLVDKVFSFEESADAFEYLYSRAHTGKVVITI
ncbi:alcohol dehydrogenase [Aureobasidium sp. EXF-12298]|nr:alcohol dehydrogenase [Aureobasidium sp. EXF-12298]